MSTNQTQLIGGGQFITDPRHLPICQLAESALYIKSALNTSTNCTDANAAAFFTALAKRGAQASMATANTYVTAATLTGRGRLYQIVAPTNTGAGYLPTVEVVADGITYTIAPSGNLAAAARMVIGVVSPGVPSVNSAGAPVGGEVLQPNAGGDYGFTGTTVSGLLTPGSIGLVDPILIESLNMPFLQFESSCVVRFKTDLLASGTGDKIGGVTYRMLP